MALVFGLCSALFGQAGALDLDFGTNGIVTTPFLLGYDNASSVAIQSDGKIIVAGSSQNGKTHDFTLARFNPNGTLDDSFGEDGIVASDFGDFGAARAVAIQSDGKIVVVGVSGFENLAIARYNMDGTLDDNFGSNGLTTTVLGFPYGGLAVAIQTDGKIVVAGSFLARYNSDGSLDDSFGINGVATVDIGIKSIAIQPDGKIVAAGGSWNGSNSDFALARYNSDGTLDNSFGSNGLITTNIGINDEANSIGMQADMKIVLAGYSSNNFALARYHPDGALDSTFASDGILTTDFGGTEVANSIALLPDGKIVAAGRRDSSFIYIDFALARYNPDGSLDNNFGLNGKLTTDFGGGNDEASSLALQPDGKIIVVGSANFNIDRDFALARYNSNGTLDASFGLDGMVTMAIGKGDIAVTASTLQPDGKMLVAGSLLHRTPEYASEDFFDRFIMVRYNKDGTLDGSFGSGGIYLGFIIGGYDYGFQANALAIQADNNILAGKTNWNHPGISIGSIARFFPNGSPGTVDMYIPNCFLCHSGVNTLAIQSDRKILAGGWVNYNFVIARFNTDGTLDENFGLDGVLEVDFGGDDIGRSLVIQPDGKIVLVGNTSSDFALARCDSNGILDNNFGVGGMVLSPDFGHGNAATIQPDGKIVVGGNVLARYEVNGALDNSFGLNGKVDLDFIAHSLALQPDGKILATGISVLARFNSDGTLDGAFGSGGILITSIGEYWSTNYVALQPDGKIIVAGESDGDFAVARYLSGLQTSVWEKPESKPVILNLSPNPVSDFLKIHLPVNITSMFDVQVFDAQGRLMLSQQFTAGDALRVGHLPGGVFMVKVTDGERVYVGRFVKQ